MKRIMCSVLVLSLLFVAGAVHAKKTVVKAVGGTVIPSYGLVIDASYDPKLDTFVPGYKMLNVAIVNTSFNIVEMDPKKDMWWIKTKNGDKKFKLIGDLRGEDPQAWSKIPEKARNLISYPLLLPIGAQQAIALFVPENVPVADFNEIIIYINSFNTTFEVLARQ